MTNRRVVVAIGIASTMIVVGCFDEITGPETGPREPRLTSCATYADEVWGKRLRSDQKLGLFCHEEGFLDLFNCSAAEQNEYYLAIAEDRWRWGWPSDEALFRYRRCLEREQ